MPTEHFDEIPLGTEWFELIKRKISGLVSICPVPQPPHDIELNLVSSGAALPQIT